VTDNVTHDPGAVVERGTAKERNQRAKAKDKPAVVSPPSTSAAFRRRPPARRAAGSVSWSHACALESEL
jgi:hypothetical protein